MIISLLLTLVIFGQSCAVSFGGSVGKNEMVQQGGAVGILVALLFLVRGAFVLGIPIVSVIAFALGALLAFAAAATTAFSDLTFWGFVGLILAVMSFFGFLGKRRERAGRRVQ
jgi:hypothetical protein